MKKIVAPFILLLTLTICAYANILIVRQGTSVPTISFVAATTSSSTSGSLTCTLPAGTQNGDLVLSWIANNTSTAYNSRSDFFSVRSASASSALSSTLYMQFANNPPVGGWTWTGLGTASECITRTYRNVYAVAPFDDALPTKIASATSLATSILTPTTAVNEENISFWSQNSTQSITGPGGLSNISSDNAALSVYSGDAAVSTVGTVIAAKTATVTTAGAWGSVAVNLIGALSPPSQAAFSVASPASNQTIAGSFAVNGNAGTTWAGINFFAAVNCTQLVPSNISPSTGTYSGSINTTLLSNGSQNIQAVAFKADGTPSAPINIAVNVNNANITFVCSSAPASANVSPTPITSNVCSGVQTGDVLLSYVANQATVASTPPAGWTLVTTAVNDIQSSSLWYRVATAADVGNVTYTWTNTNYPVIQTKAYRGVYTGGSTPIDNSATCVTATATSCTISGIAATQTAQEVEVGFWDFNLPASVITGPASFANTTNYNTQRAFFSGDTTLGLAGVSPSAVTASASGATNLRWDAIAVTLLSGGIAPPATPPSIASQPNNVTVTAGSVAAFTVTANGTLPLFYQWYVVPSGGGTGSIISGATNSSYSFTTALSDSGKSYYVIVTNSVGAAQSTPNAVLTVNPVTTAPTISSQPSSTTIACGSTVTFSVTANGTAPLFYQWYVVPAGGGAGVLIQNETNSSYSSIAALSNSGKGYYVVVTNSVGSTQSVTALLTVTGSTAPDTFVVSSPASGATVSGSAFPVSVTSGTTWVNAACFFGVNSTKVCSDTSPVCTSGNCTFSLALNTTTLPIPDGVQTIAVTGFSVPAGQGGGTQTTVSLSLNVCNNCGPSAPVIASGQPTDQTGIIGSTALFTVSITGSPTPSCVWNKNGVAISPPATSCSSYTTPFLALTDNGSTYSVVATNSQGQATSRNALLTVQSTPPVIASGQPIDQTVFAGSTATFNVSISGSPSPTCVWKKNGVNISPAQTSCTSYSLSTTLADNGSTYSVVATNPSGQATSRNALLTVNSVVASSTFDSFGMPNPPPSPNNKTAIPAIAWDTSVGANVCGNSSCCTGCTNGSGSQATDIQQIAYTGVKTLRTDHTNLQWMINITAPLGSDPTSGGAKYCMLLGNTSPNPTTLSLTTVELDAAKKLLNAGVLRCLEGLNEPETQNDTYNGVQCDFNSGNDWKSCAQFMHDMYTVLRGDPSLNNIAFYGISDNGAEGSNGSSNYGTQFAWLPGIPAGAGTNGFYPVGTIYSNGGVSHNYNSGQPPNRPNTQWECGSPNENVNCHSPFYTDYIHTWAGGFNGISVAQAGDVINFPRISTEWNSDSSSSAAGTDDQGVRQVNTIIDYFNRGTKVTEIFGLIAPSGNHNQGLYGYPSLAKFPGADYFHSITHFMADKGDVPSPGTVNWSFSGCPTGGNMGQNLCHGLLLQKSSTAFYNPGSYDLLMTYEPGNSTSINFSLSLGATFSHVNVYDATTVVTPAQNLPSSPTPVVSCAGCSSINIPWSTLGHSGGLPPPLIIEFF